MLPDVARRPHRAFAMETDDALRKLSATVANSWALCADAIALLPHRNPDLQPAIAGKRIEFLVVALEVRRVRRLEAGGRQPVIPDGVDGAADGRDVFVVGEDRVFLFGNPHAGEFTRQVGEIGNLDAGDVIEVSGIVAVAADAVRKVADPVRNIAALLVDLLPLAGNPGPLF